MRHIIRLNRHDITTFMQGEPIDFDLKGDTITWEFDGPRRHAPTPNGHTPASKKATERRMHSDAFKRAAVARFKRARASGKETGEQIAADLGIHRSLLSAWTKAQA
jgi:hypothetical protein